MLFDNHQRRHTYLRLAVTDRCNLRCRYCMPAEGIAFAPRADLLSFEEIQLVCSVLAEMGVTKVRLTGGEPLSRKDLPLLVEQLGQLFPTLAMTTNGSLLPQHLDQLLAAGMDKFNISLDTLQPAKFLAITRRDAFHHTWSALELLSGHGIHAKVNIVVMRGQNDDEILDFVELTRNRTLTVRFIEAMPFNEGDGNRQLFVSASEIEDRIAHAFPALVRSATVAGSSAIDYRIPGHRGRVSIIPAYSRSLCGTCNRLRLTPKGTLLNCLYATRGLELRPLLRRGAGRDDIRDLITEFVRGKHVNGHVTQRLEQRGLAFASMTSIGG